MKIYFYKATHDGIRISSLAVKSSSKHCALFEFQLLAYCYFSKLLSTPIKRFTKLSQITRQLFASRKSIVLQLREKEKYVIIFFWSLDFFYKLILLCQNQISQKKIKFFSNFFLMIENIFSFEKLKLYQNTFTISNNSSKTVNLF